MPKTLGKEIAALHGMTTSQLRDRYLEAFGETTKAGNRTWIIKRIAWRLQAVAEGDLSERARQRAAELARDEDLRLIPPKETSPAPRVTIPLVSPADRRLPRVGTVIERKYKGSTLLVTVLADGFEYEGEKYNSLSAVAKQITGTHLSGIAFFRLAKESTR
jgi:hypothetical protein